MLWAATEVVHSPADTGTEPNTTAAEGGVYPVISNISPQHVGFSMLMLCLFEGNLFEFMFLGLTQGSPPPVQPRRPMNSAPQGQKYLIVSKNIFLLFQHKVEGIQGKHFERGVGGILPLHSAPPEENLGWAASCP